MSEQKEKQCKFRTTIGGQALIEGILMRGPGKQAIVIRSKDGLVEKVENVVPLKEKCPVLGWPIIRGSVVFVESMIKGVRALMYSADFFPDDEDSEPGKFDKWCEKTFGSEKMEKIIVGFSVLLSLVITVGLFFLLPTFLAGLVDPFIHSAAIHNLIESVVKLAIFTAYLALCSCQKDIQRVLRYHGAEHKTIFCYEAGLPLTVENCRIQSRFHPRCGTNMLFLMMIVSILISSVVFSFVNWRNLWLRFALHLLLLIPIVGLTYEVIHYIGGHDNPVANFLVKPGLQMQRFTTREPDDSMLEVAIRAVELVKPEKPGEDKW